MASPFKIFRKNAKVLLVGLFLMSMISFVIIPALLEYLGATRGTSAPPVVVTQRFGSLTEQQMESLWTGQAAVQRFLESLQDLVSRRQGNPMQITMFRQTLGELSEEQVVRLWLLARYAEAAGMAISDVAVNRYIQDLLNSAGVAISPQDLQEIMTRQRISEDALFSGMNLALLAIRYAELSGVDPWRFLPGYAGETPGQRWDYFLRLRRMASVELVEIPLEKFSQRVTPPSDAQLRQLFETHKTRLPQPNSPDPGFKVPEKVRFEYLQGDVTVWLERTAISEDELRRVYEERKDELFLAPQTSAALPDASGVTGRVLTTPEAAPPATTTVPPPGETAAPNSGKVPKAEESPKAEEASKPEEASKTEEAPKAGESSKVEEKPDAEGSLDAEESPEAGDSPEMPAPNSAPEQPQETAPSGPSPESAEPPMPTESAPESAEDGSSAETPAASDGSAVAIRPAVRLVGYAEEGAAPAEETPVEGAPREDVPAEEAPKEEAPAEGATTEEAPGEAAPIEGASADQPEPSPAEPGDATMTPPALDAPAENPPAEKASEENVPAEPGPAAPPESAAVPAASATPPASETPAAPDMETPQAPPEKPKYRPFEEVREEVRRIVAAEQMRAKLDKIEEEMRRYQVAWGNYLSAVESAKEAKAAPPEPPQRPNLEEIARREGFRYGRTELLPRWELESLEIGKSVDSQGVSFSQVIFDLREFLTARTFDVNQNQYLAWPIERVEEHVPELSDPGVREEVLQAWMQIEGRKIAETECARLASEAEKSGKTLAEFLAGTEEFRDVRIVPETEPFTWMTYGELDLAWAASRPPFLSSIRFKRKDPASGLVVDEDAVDQPGNDFMAAVFALQPDQVGVAWNQPRSKAYLVRVIEMQPPPAQLYDAFVRQNQQTYMSVSWYDRIEAYGRWSRNLEEQAGLRWNRAPARASRR